MVVCVAAHWLLICDTNAERSEQSFCMFFLLIFGVYLSANKNGARIWGCYPYTLAPLQYKNAPHSHANLLEMWRT